MGRRQAAIVIGIALANTTQVRMIVNACSSLLFSKDIGHGRK